MLRRSLVVAQRRCRSPTSTSEFEHHTQSDLTNLVYATMLQISGLFLSFASVKLPVAYHCCADCGMHKHMATYIGHCYMLDIYISY